MNLKLKKIFLIVFFALDGLMIYAALKPAEYTISREAPMQASPEKIFPLINSARESDRWMPWAAMDPKLQMMYSGPESGAGSKASWDSRGRMGAGSSTISESVANQSVKFDLEYTKPFQMKQKAEISIQPAGSGSIVRWSVSGRNPFPCRFMGLFMNMDKMVGGLFDKGLATLKTLVEA